MSVLGMFLRSFLLQAGFADEGRQALGFAWAMDPALGSAEARARHLAPFNANPYVAGIILGTTAALEGRGLAVRASALKSAASASLSAAADALFWGSLRPLAAALAVFTAVVFHHLHLPHPLFWGAFAGLAVFNIPAMTARWVGLSLGLAQAEGTLVVVARLPVQVWIARARMAAVFLLVGASALASISAETAPPSLTVVAFLAGLGLSRRAGGSLRLVAAAGLLGVVAAAGGWTL